MPNALQHFREKRKMCRERAKCFGAPYTMGPRRAVRMRLARPRDNTKATRVSLRVPGKARKEVGTHLRFLSSFRIGKRADAKRRPVRRRRVPNGNFGFCHISRKEKNEVTLHLPCPNVTPRRNSPSATSRWKRCVGCPLIIFIVASSPSSVLLDFSLYQSTMPNFCNPHSINIGFFYQRIFINTRPVASTAHLSHILIDKMRTIRYKDLPSTTFADSPALRKME